VHHAAPDRAHVAHLHVANSRRRFREQRTFLTQQCRTLDVVVRRRGADMQLPGLFADVVQVFQRAQVHKMVGGGEPQLHHGDETHSACKRLCAAGEQMQRFVERFRSSVLKSLCDHVCGSLILRRKNFPDFFRRQRHVNVLHAERRERVHHGESASTTELTTAGEQPIVPASPTPLTPSGFTGDGVHV